MEIGFCGRIIQTIWPRFVSNFVVRKLWPLCNHAKLPTISPIIIPCWRGKKFAPLIDSPEGYITYYSSPVSPPLIPRRSPFPLLPPSCSKVSFIWFDLNKNRIKNEKLRVKIELLSHLTRLMNNPSASQPMQQAARPASLWQHRIDLSVSPKHNRASAPGCQGVGNDYNFIMRYATFLVSVLIFLRSLSNGAFFLLFFSFDFRSVKSSSILVGGGPAAVIWSSNGEQECEKKILTSTFSLCLDDDGGGFLQSRARAFSSSFTTIRWVFPHSLARSPTRKVNRVLFL